MARASGATSLNSARRADTGTGRFCISKEVRRRGSIPRIFLAFILSIALVPFAGCSSPADRFNDRARQFGLLKDAVPGTSVDHIVYVSRNIGLDRTLHVYLGGDGTPWVAGRPAKDPTQRRPLILDLMSRDDGAAVYLGRPCYHGTAGADVCKAWLWTNGRYAEPVVTSMAAALARFLKRHRHSRVILIGYSGGGVLAMLLAPRIQETVAVVTVAANLDIDQWADYRGYGRLVGSLNPALQPPLGRNVTQFHFAGKADRVVPARIVLAGLHNSANLTVVDGYDHFCCWSAYWPRVLSLLSGLKTRE